MTLDLFECSVCGDLCGEPSYELGEQQYLDELLADPDVDPEFIDGEWERVTYLGAIAKCERCGRIRCPSCEEWCCDG